MKTTKRNLIIGLQFTALVISIILIIYRGMEKDWATVAAALAVVAALIANLNGQRVAWRQEDEFEPDIEVQYDLQSRVDLVCLSVKNIGGSNAYDISLIFDYELKDLAGETVKLSNIPFIAKGERILILINGAHKIFEEIDNGNLQLVQTGYILFRKTKKDNKYHKTLFAISVDQFRNSPNIESDEKAFYSKAVHINDSLKAINKTLQKLSNGITTKQKE